MARTAILLGISLCGISMAGLMCATGKAPVLFVPMILGIPVLFFGVVGLNPHRRRVSQMANAGLALMGLGLVVIRGLTLMVRKPELSGDLRPIGLRVIAAMTAVCLILLVGCLIHLRRSRRQSGPDASPSQLPDPNP